jgi:hypothetical protein
VREPVQLVAPAFVIERTVWHPREERRRALLRLGGRKEALELREGDAVGTLVVVRIEPSGVVFLEAGREVRRKVGQPR